MPLKPYKKWFLGLIDKIKNDSQHFHSDPDAVSQATFALKDAGYNIENIRDVQVFISKLFHEATTTYHPSGKRTCPVDADTLLSLASDCVRSIHRPELRTLSHLAFRMAHDYQELQRYKVKVNALRVHLYRTICNNTNIDPALARLVGRRLRDEH